MGGAKNKLNVASGTVITGAIGVSLLSLTTGIAAVLGATGGAKLTGISTITFSFFLL